MNEFVCEHVCYLGFFRDVSFDDTNSGYACILL